jgi:hypothetical protein
MMARKHSGKTVDGAPLRFASPSSEAVTWIGIDEAGYGPNLGPLVVTATVWESIEPQYDPAPPSPTSPSERNSPDELWRRLFPMIRNTGAGPSRRSPPGRRRAVVRGEERAGDGVVVDDSKKLYSPSRGLKRLEHGVLSLLATTGPSPATFTSLLRAVNTLEEFTSEAPPWHLEREIELPVSIDRGDVGVCARHLTDHMARAGVRLTAVYSDVVFPSRFNALVSRFDSKGAVLADATSRLLSRAAQAPPAPNPKSHDGGPNHDGVESAPARPNAAIALVDRHGGRKSYRPLLQHTFPDDLVVCVHETRECSRYRLRAGGRPVEVSFQTGAERHLPVALASMVSKYLRELAMMLFNRFWTQHVPGLRPTAGYPVDARRFAAEVRVKQHELGIADDLMWRNR